MGINEESKEAFSNRVNPSFSEEEEYYLDPLGNMVMTEKFHRARGYCCGNGCRHCPWTHGKLKRIIRSR